MTEKISHFNLGIASALKEGNIQIQIFEVK